MNDKQTNKVRMIRALLIYCGTTPVVTATGGMTAFGNLVTDTGTKLTLIDGFDMIATGNTKGVTEDLLLIRGAMETIATKCARGTFAYANSINNNTLKQKVNWTQAKLSKMKQDEVDDVCEVIAAETTANIGSVTAYGVLAGDPAAVSAAVALFRAGIGSPRQARISITGALAQIDGLVDAIVDGNFKGQMDPMMDTLKSTAPEIVRGYYQAREILDLGHTTGKVRGECRDENDNTLNGVLFEVKRAGTNVLLGSDVSENGGKFGVANLIDEVDLFWTMAGRVPVQELAVHVGPGKELMRKVRMMPV